MRNPVVIPCLFAVWILGCGAAKKPNSTVTAVASLSGYPASPTGAAATDEKGRITSAGLDDAGRFTLTLPRGHRYRIGLGLSDRDIPVVFARGSGRFGDAFSVVSGGARVDLGEVRYVSSMQAGTMLVATGRTGSVVPIGSMAQSGSCVDGVVAGTTTLCVDDDRQVTCDDASESGESEIEQCDEPLQAACADSEAADAPGADHEASVAEHNPPDRVDGCDEEDDDGESED